MFTFASPLSLRRSPRQNGFTLIELLVVTTILILLATIGLVSYQRANQNARNSKRKSDLETVRQALVLYRTDNGAYPVGTSFDTMLTTISDYLSQTSQGGSVVLISDPQDTGSYVYSYDGPAGGATFEICGALEPSATSYCLANP